jgi:hypothetical protein
LIDLDRFVVRVHLACWIGNFNAFGLILAVVAAMARVLIGMRMVFAMSAMRMRKASTTVTLAIVDMLTS